MQRAKFWSWVGLALAFVMVGGVAAFGQTQPPSLLNVSYDVARELYKEINPAFVADWTKQGGASLTINQSHGGSSAQALAVLNGLEADVVTMNQSPDIDILVERGGLVAKDWRTKLPNEAAPYTSVSIFLVRKGNPKGIKDWSDLTKAGMQVIVPNPKTSGNGRYTYLAAWGYALGQPGGSDASAKDFVTRLFKNVPVLDGGGRGATTTFTQRSVGEVLVTFENEAVLIGKEVGSDQFEIVYPSLTIEAPAPVAIVDRVVDKRGSRKVAEAYLKFLYSDAGQEIIAKNFYRPSNPSVLAKFAAQFPPVKTFTVESALGGWEKVQKIHFAEGGTYDSISVGR